MSMTEAEKRWMGYRTPADGEPYYCTFCGLGWNEYGACEDVRCALETKEEAAKRFVPVPPRPVQIGDYSDIMDE